MLIILSLWKGMVAYLLSTKWEAKSINRLNSFPWQEYPRRAISKASLPSPAPGTRTLTSDRSLEEAEKEHLECILWLYDHKNMMLIKRTVCHQEKGGRFHWWQDRMNPFSPPFHQSSSLAQTASMCSSLCPCQIQLQERSLPALKKPSKLGTF